MCLPCLNCCCFSIETRSPPPPKTPPVTPQFKPAVNYRNMTQANRMLAQQIALDRLAEQQAKENRANG